MQKVQGYASRQMSATTSICQLLTKEEEGEEVEEEKVRIPWIQGNKKEARNQRL